MLSSLGRAAPPLKEVARERAASPAEGGEEVVEESTEEEGTGASRSGLAVVLLVAATAIAAAITDTCNEGKRIGELNDFAAEVKASDESAIVNTIRG